MEFGSPVMLRVTDKHRWANAGAMDRGHMALVSRRSDGVVVRTRAVREIPRTVLKSTWTVSLANPTHHKESNVQRNLRFRELV